MTYLEQHKNDIFKKYTDKELIKDINNYKYKNGKLTKTLNHFFEECIYNCVGSRYNNTPMQVLQNDEMMKWILNYIKSKPNFYTGNEISNVKSFMRNGTRYARKVANFCPKTAKEIYFRYHNINGDKINILDTSMGFGARMSAALLNGHNYYGVDPNKELFTKLNQYLDFLKNNDYIDTNQICEMRCQGSEKYISQWDNLFDVCFTSPPYFNLEKYSNDDSESTKNYDNYELWINNFVKPTIDNIYKYLKVGGYVMINIKNLSNKGKESLFDDWFDIFSNHSGFEFVEVFEMTHQSKKHYTDNCNYTKEQYTGFKEPVMCFKKNK